MKSFTDYIQLYKLASVRLCRYLTFVEAGITDLGELNLQCPILGGPRTDDTKALIGRVSVATYRQDMDVTVAYPRNLLNFIRFFS